jgi:hypothetical protein
LDRRATTAGSSKVIHVRLTRGVSDEKAVDPIASGLRKRDSEFALGDSVSNLIRLAARVDPTRECLPRLTQDVVPFAGVLAALEPELSVDVVGQPLRLLHD